MVIRNRLNVRIRNLIHGKKNLVRTQNDLCIYIRIRTSSKLYLFLYVDDLLILGTNLKEVERIKVISNENHG